MINILDKTYPSLINYYNAIYDDNFVNDCNNIL